MSRYEDDALSMEFRQECRQLLDETEKLLLIADESHILTQEAVKELFRFVHTPQKLVGDGGLLRAFRAYSSL